jgi:L-ribulokinase
MAKYTIGLHYDTHLLRAVIVNTANGKEAATASWPYAHGKEGVIGSGEAALARQHPADYIKGAATTIRRVISALKRRNSKFSPKQIVGIGVAATGSTPIPVDRTGMPLAMSKRFSKNPAALAWLWKDRTAAAEAEEITSLARRMRPQYLAKSGQIYSEEWFFSKILHCLRTSPDVFDAAYTWVELSDWIPALLTGTQAPEDLSVNICAAGHKAMFNRDWGGYPDEKFLQRLDPKLGALRSRLTNNALSIDQPVGTLTAEWAKKTGLPKDIPVAAGAIDAHLGAVASGVAPGVMAKNLSLAGRDIIVVPDSRPLPDIAGLCGIVDGSVVPGCYGLEAVQPAVGDIFRWFSESLHLARGKKRTATHETLARQAGALEAGQSGLLALDWHRGNRTILVDPHLTGMLVGQTLATSPAEIYRAMIEAAAFGALTIINRLKQHGIEIQQIVCSGEVAEKMPIAMQIYADVTGRPMKLVRSAHPCATGAAIAGAVAAKVHGDIPTAQQAMTGVKKKIYQPDPRANAVYKRLYQLYKQLHDAFGTTAWRGNCHNIMKELLEIRAETQTND